MSGQLSPLQLFMADFLREQDDPPIIYDDNAHIHVHHHGSYCNSVDIEDDTNDYKNYDENWQEEEEHFSNVCRESLDKRSEHPTFNYNYTNPLNDNDEFSVYSAVSSLSSCSFSAFVKNQVSAKDNYDNRWDSGSLASLHESPLVPRRRCSSNQSRHDLLQCSFPTVVEKKQSAPSLPRRQKSNTGNDFLINCTIIKGSSRQQGYSAKTRSVKQEKVEVEPVLRKDTTRKFTKLSTAESLKTQKSQNAGINEILDAAITGIMLDDHH